MINIYHSNEKKSNLVERMEQKFYLPPRDISRAYALLRHICIPDNLYPQERISSLYFDTADLDEHEASVSGELRKRKIRIRWYNTLAHYNGSVPVFMELKSRDGFASYKQRQRTEVDKDYLTVQNLSRGIVPRNDLIDTLALFGHYPEKPLQPVITITYWRDRFIEPLSGRRIALDSHIQSIMIDRKYGSFGALTLAGGVIELKGRSLELPLPLRQMHLLDIDWGRFSKYSSCLDAHFSATESSGGAWPSGKNNPY